MRGTSALACGLALLMLAACAAPAEESSQSSTLPTAMSSHMHTFVAIPLMPV